MNASQTTRTTSGEARRCVPAAVRTGFTLVELMVAITIIAILAAIAVPAVTIMVGRGKDTAIRMEISGLEQAVNQYEQKYGDRPPDGSSWSVLNRHMKSVFPRMADPDVTLLYKLTHPNGSSFSPVAMDRAEALVFFLGGFSSDIQHPLTGPGGPLEYMGSGDVTDLDNYQYNADRDTFFWDFEPQRLTIGRAQGSGRYTSSDETDFDQGTGQVANAQHGFTGGIGDLLPTYLVKGGTVPILYFDSRTYGLVGPDPSNVDDYNGYRLPGDPGGCRPYKTGFNHELPSSGGSYGSVTAAFNAVKFKNPETFQIISPGRDGIYGSVVGTPGELPVHFTAESGTAVYPNASASNFNGLVVEINGRRLTAFQEVDFLGATENGQYDNITNFSGTTLENDLEQ